MIKLSSTKARIAMIVIIIFTGYFGSALVYRSHKNKDTVVDQSNRTYDSEEDAIDHLLSPFNQSEPTKLERFYAPAESIFRLIGI